MTLQEAKDKFAVQQGFKDWNDYNVFMFHTHVTAAKRQLAVDGAIELYATSKVSDFKSSLRKRIEERLAELDQKPTLSGYGESRLVGQEDECKKFLELIETTLPD